MRLSTDDLGVFFAPEHHALAAQVRAVAERLRGAEAAAASDREIVALIAELFPLCVPADGALSSRSLCLVREGLAYASARADSIFAVQGLGTHAIGAAGDRARLAPFARGEQVAAFALTEPDAGSDVAAIATRAVPAGDGAWHLTGEKLFISNLGIADFALVVASTASGTSAASAASATSAASGTSATSASRSAPTAAKPQLSAFWVDLAQPGAVVTPLVATAPHPIGALSLTGARGTLVGEVGHGMRLALATLDAFRVSVGAAAVGMARRALDEALAFVTARHQFGKPLAEQQLVQAHLADMAVDLDAARLLVLRAAHAKDTGTGAQVHVSIAKLGATEAAQRVIDRAVQLFGGRGVMHGAVVEHLYRAIRPLRIYEGTSEIQRTIIGRALAKEATTR